MTNSTAGLLTEAGGVIEFRAEAEELTAAIKRTGLDLGKVKDSRSRALFLMRGCYLLGVQRGGETVRASEEPASGQFSLSGACARRFLDELAGLSPLTLAALCKAIGM